MTQELNKYNPLERSPLLPLIAKYSIPSIISMLVITAYNITDQIFIGNVVGMLGNAATNVAFPIVTLCSALSQLIGVGAAANFNISMGAKKENRARSYLGNGLSLMILVALSISILTKIFAKGILLISGATPAVLPYAQVYLGITAFGLFFQLIIIAGSMLIRADGSPNYSMFVNVTGALLNVFLDYLFMIKFGWGIKGAALATVIGQGVSAILCISYFFRFKSVRISRDIFKLEKVYTINIVKLGMGNFINQVILMTVNIILNNSLKYYGSLTEYGSDIPLAVSGVVAKLNMILISFAVGLSQGCQPIWGYNLGARNYNRVKDTYKIAGGIIAVLSVIALILFQTFPREVTSIFGNGDQLYFAFAEKYIKIYLLGVCVIGFQPITINYFSAIGKVSQSLIVSLSRQAFLLIPLLLILPRVIGMTGILIAGPIADFTSFLITMILVYLNFKNFDRKKEIE